MIPRILIAGVGNIFLGDDGFGVEVARRLALQSMPVGVTVADYGIRGIHLAHQLLEPYDLAILVDAVSRGAAPGTIFLIEPEVDVAVSDDAVSDAHDLVLEHVFSMVETLGGKLPRTLIVGCEAADIGEGIGLSPTVEAAIDEALAVIRTLVHDAATQIRQASIGATSNSENEKSKEA
jgi:hydrogenase maturation protease